VGALYRESWRRHFSARVRASSLFAALTTAPATQALAIAVMSHVPAMLTWGAWWSGKSQQLRAVEAAA